LTLSKHLVVGHSLYNETLFVLFDLEELGVLFVAQVLQQVAVLYPCHELIEAHPIVLLLQELFQEDIGFVLFLQQLNEPVKLPAVQCSSELVAQRFVAVDFFEGIFLVFLGII